MIIKQVGDKPKNIQGNVQLRQSTFRKYREIFKRLPEKTTFKDFISDVLDEALEDNIELEWVDENAKKEPEEKYLFEELVNV